MVVFAGFLGGILLTFQFGQISFYRTSRLPANILLVAREDMWIFCYENRNHNSTAVCCRSLNVQTNVAHVVMQYNIFFSLVFFMGTVQQLVVQ